MNHFKGSTLIIVLILTSLLGLSVIASFKIIHRNTQNINGEMHSHIARERAIEKVFNALGSVPNSANRNIYCTDEKGLKGFHEIRRALCVAHYPVNFSLLSSSIIDTSTVSQQKMPGFNFNQLFDKASPCDTIPFSWNERAPSGIQLGMTSVVSSQTCTIHDSQDINDLRVLSNLSISAPITTIAAAAPEDHATLAAIGFADINAVLSIETNSLIVAGGDLYIKTLANQSAKEYEVSLISSSGLVHIEQITGTLRLKAIARDRVFLPRNYQPSSEQLLLPPLLEILPFCLL